MQNHSLHSAHLPLPCPAKTDKDLFLKPMTPHSRIFSVLFLAVFATTLGVGLVVPLLPVYAHDLGAGAFQIGLIFGAFSLSRTLFVPLFGRLSDIKGKKPFLSLGLFLYTLLSLGFVFSDHVAELTALRLGQGFASAMILPVAQAYVGVITPKDREGLTMGLFNVALFAGLSVGPLLGGLVEDAFGIRVSFLSMAFLTLTGFLLCRILLPAEEPSSEPRSPKAGRGAPYLRILRQPSVFSLFAFRLGFTTAIGTVWAFLPLMASTRFGLTSAEIGVIVMLNVLISGALQTPMGYVADRFNKTFLIIAGGVLAAAAMLSFHWASSFLDLCLANAVLGVAGGVSFPAVMALGVIAGREKGGMGTVMGLLAMAHSLGMLSGPLLAGALLDLSSFGAVFVAGSAVLVTGTALFLGLHRRFETGTSTSS